MKIEMATTSDIPTLCTLLDYLFSQEVEFKPDHETQSRGLKMILNNNFQRYVYLIIDIIIIKIKIESEHETIYSFWFSKNCNHNFTNTSFSKSPTN